MSGFDEMVARMSQPVVAPVQPVAKQDEVALASDEKRAALNQISSPQLTSAQAYEMAATRVTGNGRNTRSPEMAALGSATPAELRERFGKTEAERAVIDQLRGLRDFNNDRTGTRSTERLFTDTATDVGSGFANAGLGIGAAVLGIANTDAGVWAARGLQSLNEVVQGTQSQDLQARRRAVSVQNELASRDNTAAMETERANGGGNLITSLRRITRDAVDTVVNTASDPATLGSGIAQGVGSLLAAGPLGKAIGAAGNVVSGAAARVAPEALTAGLARLGETAAGRVASRLTPSSTAVGVGMTEGGNAFSSATNEALKALESRTDLTDDQKKELANRAGLRAAGLTAPLAMAAGSLVSRFESAPLRVGSVRGAANNLFDETVEEAIQGGVGQGAQNYALRSEVDPSRSLSEGVGEQAGTGALFGLGTAGVVQAPGTAGAAVRGAANAVGSAVGSVLDQRTADLRARNDASSPASDSVVTERAATVAQAAPAMIQTLAETAQQVAAATTASMPDAAPEVAAQAATQSTAAFQDLADKITEVSQFDPAPLVANEQLPPVLREAFGKSDSRVGAIRNLADVINTAKPDSSEAITAAAYMNGLLTGYENVVNSDAQALEALPNEHPAAQILKQFDELFDTVLANPAVGRAMQKLAEVQSAMEARAKQDAATGIEPTNQAAINNTVSLAEQAPGKGDRKAVTAVLEHAESGRIQLTPDQRNALLASKAVLDAVEKAKQEAGKLGLSKPINQVSDQVMTRNNPDDPKLSTLEHVKRIVQSIRAGNQPQARAQLERMGQFVQNMANKVEALNTQFREGGERRSYQAFNPQEEVWYESTKDRVYVSPTSVTSLNMAQTVALEGQRLADIHNSLAKAFPDLGVKPKAAIKLDAALQGPVQDVAREFKEGKRVRPVGGKPTETTTSTPTAVPATTEETSTAPTPAGSEDTREGREDTADITDPAVRKKFDALLDEADKLSKKITRVGMSKLPPEVRQLYFMFTDMKRDISGQSSADSLLEAAKYAQSIGRSDLVETMADLMEYHSKTTGQEMLDHGDAADAKSVEQNRESFKTLAQKLRELIKPAEKPPESKPPEKPPESKPPTKPAEKPPAEETIEETSEETKTEKVEAFPNLIGSTEGSPLRNLFKEAFKRPKNAISRLAGQASPVRALREALASREAFERFMGPDSKRVLNEDVGKQYREYLALAPEIMDAMNGNLQAFVAKRLKGDLSKLTDQRFMHWENTKLLNVMEQQDGKLVYNQELLESAVLAGLQWMLTAQQSGSAWMDYEAMAEMLDVSEAQVMNHSAVLNELNKSVSSVEATRQLSQKIQDFWGVKAGRDVPLGIASGIPEAMAKEVIRALVQANQLTSRNVRVTSLMFSNGESSIQEASIADRDANGKTLKVEGAKTQEGDVQTENVNEEIDDTEAMLRIRDYPRFTFPAVDENDPLKKDLSLIEKAVLTTPKDINYFGDAKPPVADTQRNNPLIPNTENQMQMIRNESETVHNINEPVVELYEAMTGDVLVDLFGAGALNDRVMNQNHKESLEGKNLNIRSAYDTLKGVLAEARQQSVPLGEVAIRYAYNVSKVGRLQMLGRFNPQANKLMREAILPTWSTLDLSGENQQHTRAYQIALGQQLGIKVHGEHYPTITREVDERLEKLDPVVAQLSKFLTTKALPTNIVEILKTNFKEAGVDLTPGSLHAVLDYARLQQSKSPESFRTAMYLEADGVTNGVVNAMALITTGEYTGDELRNLEKGGLMLRANGPQNMNELRAGMDPEANDGRVFQKDNDKDLYQTATDHLRRFQQDFLSKLNQSMQGDDKRAAYNAKMVKTQLNHMMKLMEMFFPTGHIAYNSETGDLSINRGVMKNPLTISLYGSGEAGIAGKLTSVIVDAIYERMSSAAEFKAQTGEHSWEVSMFAKDSVTREDSMRRFEAFTQHYYALTDNVVKEFEGQLYIKKDPQRSKDIDAKTYKVPGKELSNLQQNIHMLFVRPMTAAIKATVGETLFDSAQLIIKSTQSQSIFLEAAFKRGVEARLAKKAEDPNWVKADFLTQGELAEIFEAQKHLAPMIHTKDQTFFPAGKSSTDVAKMAFSKDLGDRQSTPAFVYGPAQAGVAAMPSLIIGFGDGMMIQNGSVDNGSRKTLSIFDGVHSTLDEIIQNGQIMNAAVWKSWQGNPLQSLAESFGPFMQVMEREPITPAMAKALTRTFKVFGDPPVLEPADIRRRMGFLLRNLENAALEVEARRMTLAGKQLGVDQMAAAKAPFKKSGTAIAGQTHEEIAAELNAELAVNLTKVQEKAAEKALASTLRNDVAPVAPRKVNLLDKAPKASTAEVTPKPTEVTPKPVTYGRIDKKSGSRVLSPTAINKIAKNLGLSPTQQAIFDQIRRTKAANDYTVVYGTVEELTKFAENQGDTFVGSASSKGYMNPASKTIYLTSNSRETLVHELIHAATYAKLEAYYADPGSFSLEEMAAVQRLEKLMDQFMGLEVSGFNVGNARTAIRKHQSTGNSAAALNEFMAWGLANKDMNETLAATQSSSLAQLVKDTFKAIKNFIFGKAKIVEPGNDMLSNLLFNTAIVVRTQPSLQERLNDSVLHMSVEYGQDERLQEINEGFTRKIAAHLKSGSVGLVRNRGIVAEAITKARNLAYAAEANGFDMTMQAKHTFARIVTALATEAALDPNTLSTAQSLYTHVVKNLDGRSFMRDPMGSEPDDIAQSNLKYDVVVGKIGMETDPQKRSSLLPVFLGLAATSDEFRAVLAKMDLPKSVLQEWNTLDGVLTNAGNILMDSLGDRVSGLKSTANINEAIDALSARMVEDHQANETMIDQFASKAGGLADRWNTTLVEGMTSLADAAVEATDKLNQKHNTKLTNALAGGAKLVAAIASETQADSVAQMITTTMNNLGGYRTFRETVTDMVGRTLSNKYVYDLIKRFRSNVQQDRQAFRENVPSVMAKKFKTKLTDEQWTTLFKGMGQTDLAALVGNMSKAEILSMLKDPRQVNREITRLEGVVKNLDPNHANRIMSKAKQLATHMTIGEYGTNLLRNAEAVAKLLNEPRIGARPAVGQDLIKAVDNLTTLYALREQPKAALDSMAQLAKDEGEGMDFVLSYLVGQRAEEMSKAASGRARLNHYKGHIPSTQKEGLSLVVADARDHTALMEKSYQRVGTYGGSAADPTFYAAGLSYYFAPVSAKSPFNQGLMQNVKATASGVEASTGYTDGMTAGRISDPDLVAKITKRLGQEKKTTENLMPVFNEDGQVLAYERSVDPAQLVRLQRETHLAKMIGVWRGRQVEERKAGMYNEELITKLHEMYRKDMQGSSSKKSQYVNLLDLKQEDDPVLYDAVSLMSQDVRDYARSVFGEDALYVRKDMLNDAVGYRNASVGDAWTGITRWSPEKQEQIKRIALGVMGNDAYRKLFAGEQVVQNFIKDAKMVIVVKSVVVPTANFISNIYQMISRGVPWLDIIRQMPKKISEINAYTKNRLREIELEAELRAAEGNPVRSKPFEVELKSIQDSYRRLSIWPLIQAGEFSSISDVGISRDEILLSEGRWHEYMERLTEKLPDGIRTAGRYAIITKDTALFQGLQKAVEYGDFLAKAIIYDDITVRQKKPKEYALGRVTEEFVNYDRLPGRFRGAMEANGLMWFYHFKIRSVKIALSTIRNNPVHALLANVLPEPPGISGIGTPLTDNLVAKGAEGALGNSMGPWMAFSALRLNPWLNLAH